MLQRKIKSAVTDSDGIIKFDKDNKPGISNLLTIYSSLTNKSIKELETQYENEGYGTFKTDLSEVVKDFLVHFQEKYNEFYNSDRLDDILDQGRDKAQKLLLNTEKMERAMGLGRKRY